MGTLDVWLAIVLLLLAGAGITAGVAVDESEAGPRHVLQDREAVVPATDAPPPPGRVDDPAQALAERLIRLLAVNSLLTTQLPLDLR